MKRTPYYSLLCGALFASLPLAHAAIQVGPTGSPIETFTATPAVANWATYAAGGGAGDVTAVPTLIESLANVSAAEFTTAVATSGTAPPSANNLFRRNTTRNYLQSRTTGNAYNQLLATLQNATGSSQAFLNINYDLIKENANPTVEELPGFEVFWSATGDYGSWQHIPALSGETVGPRTATISLGSWANGANLYILWTDDNGSGEEGAYAIDNFQAVAAAGREVLFSSINSNPYGFLAKFAEGTGSLIMNQSTLVASVNGTTVPTQVSKAGDVITVTHTSATTLTPGVTNQVIFTFNDNGNPAQTYSFTNSFVVAPFTVIPASLAVTGVDTTKPGFKARVHQIAGPRNPGDQNTIQNAERQLAGLVINPDTGTPYANDADLSLAVNGYFEVPGYINWSQDAPTGTGSFSDLSTPPVAEEFIPGIPGIGGSYDHIAAEVLTYLDLKPGAYRMAVNSDDGFKVTVGQDPRDQFALVLGSFNAGRGVQDTPFDFIITEAGIYPFRLLWFEGTGGAALEWFTIAADGTKTLINDRSTAAGVRAYREGPQGAPYMKFLSHGTSNTNVAGGEAFTFVLGDGATQVQPSSVQLFVNDQAVAANVSKSGSDTTISYDPPGTLAPETVLNFRVVFSDTATPAVSRTYSFTYKIEPRVIVDINDTTIWKYDNTGRDLGTAWRERNFNDTAWLSGPAMFGAGDTGIKGGELIRTEIFRVNQEDQTTQIITDYFRHRFNYDGNPASVNLLLSYLIDDSAVFYLNGVELHRYFIPAGPVNYLTVPLTDHEADVKQGPFVIPATALIRGENVLAVEVHNNSLTSSDTVMGVELAVVQRLDVGPAAISSTSPVAGSTNVAPLTPIEILLTDGTTEIIPESIGLRVNGQRVSASVVRPGGGILTRVTYTPTTRYPSESTVTVVLEYSDTGAPNVVKTHTFTFDVQALRLVPVDATTLWSYNNTGMDLGTAWREVGYNDAAWPKGAAALGTEVRGGTPLRTTIFRINQEDLTTQIVTDYFRHRFNFDGNPALVELYLSHLIDDGAVFYLNGVEILRFGLAEGAAYDFSTTFADPDEADWVGPVVIPGALLRRGENVLAVEVHQVSAGSSDTVFAVELEARTRTDVGPAGVTSNSPLANAVNVSTNAAIELNLADGTTEIVQSSVRLLVNGQPVNASVVRPPGSSAVRVTYTPTTPYAPESVVNVRLEFADTAAPTTVRTHDFSFTTEASINVIVGINDTQMWRYNNTGTDLGTAWKEKAFNDSAWPEGAAIFAAETDATTEPIRTVIQRVGADGVNNVVTDYFRTRFNFNGNPATTRLQLRFYVDDGAVFYLNGVEVLRFGIEAGVPVTYNTFFAGNEGRNIFSGPFEIPSDALVQGENVLAVEVHQPDLTSSDSLFGAQLAIITSTAPVNNTPAEFTNVALSGGNIVLTWTGAGTLESSPSLTNPTWTAVTGATSPHSAPTSDTARFFRVRR